MESIGTKVKTTRTWFQKFWPNTPSNILIVWRREPLTLTSVPLRTIKKRFTKSQSFLSLPTSSAIIVASPHSSLDHQNHMVSIWEIFRKIYICELGLLCMHELAAEDTGKMWQSVLRPAMTLLKELFPTPVLPMIKLFFLSLLFIELVTETPG